jgi:Fe-S-cluster containining protein
MIMHFYAKGLHFSCKRCSTCCRFEAGFVFLSEKDAFLLGTALKMEYAEFLETCCRWVPVRDGENQLSLKEKSNCDCIFWTPKQGGGCSVYETRPLQCRTFPFWSSVLNSESAWEMTAKSCPGMNQGSFHSQDSIKEYLSMRQMEPIVSRNI